MNPIEKAKAALKACEQFLEDMHIMPVDWTVEESQKMHTQVREALASLPATGCAKANSADEARDSQRELEKARTLIFECYSRPGDSFRTDEAWAIWQHEKVTEAFSLLQKYRANIALYAAPIDRDAIIEECAAVCDQRADEHKYGAVWSSQRGEEADNCATAIRALKTNTTVSQDDKLDAERYRWLRQFPTHFGKPEWGIYGAGLPLDRTFIDRAERLDAAIDQAIRGGGNEIF